LLPNWYHEKQGKKRRGGSKNETLALFMEEKFHCIICLPNKL
jgi:hypothetical protein